MSKESSAWIESKFFEWQRENGRASLAKFAAYIGASPDSLNNWISRKQTPTGASVHLLADKLGPDIYAIVGMTPPDPRLAAIVKYWGKLSEAKKAELYAEAERLAALDEQIAQAGRGGRPADPADILARARELRDDPDIWSLPPAELRAMIVRALPALYVHQGRLVAAPQAQGE